ncbi:hypothetical protein GCK72_015442 [Caenorhabditis remanei]|uniref:F-box domain-containing protein n=1 Tax=Caenorhabditis remanei TaxID=31234 RepID=A0A6A5GX89_CAERE|nr:hypothetical protein GCK72_015442 [Caenorhabditis remanei]KAF1758982.1 hypothetical protein GCK72_015442 [Caenorhabditis remanei]
MDPPKPFPILRLPFVSIQEVFKAMDTFEIINFSMVSKRTKGIAKHMTFYSKYSIQFSIGQELEVMVMGPKYMTQCFYLFTTNQEMNGKVVDNNFEGWNEILVWKYSDNPIEEWKQLCIYVLEIFKKQTIVLFSIILDTYVEQNVSIIDFLMTNVKSVEKCHLFHAEERNDVDEHAAYVLENIKITFELLLCLHIKIDDFISKIPKDLKKLTILESKSVGYERLLEIDCKSVVLKDDQITNEQWNSFFKKWIAMETNQNLEYLELKYRELGTFRDHVLDDIPHEEVDEGVKRVLKTSRNATQEINGGIDIRRIDGKTATFFVYRVFSTDRFAMSIH